MEIEREVIEAYFGSNGFLVRQTVRVEDPPTKKKLGILPVLAVFNPLVHENNPALGFRLFTGDLPKIRSGLVALLGWGNTSFSNSLLTSDTRLLKHFKQETKDNRVADSFEAGPELTGSGFGNLLRLLVVPALPRSEGKLGETFSYLRGLGVDGVFTLRSLLENLLRQSFPSNLYHGNSIFQILQLMKAYELIREPQLEMFPE
jgi:hypothetical protein